MNATPLEWSSLVLGCLVWVTGLIPAILIRYLYLRRPIRTASAAWRIVIAIYIGNIILWALLGMGSIFILPSALLAWVLNKILRGWSRHTTVELESTSGSSNSRDGSRVGAYIVVPLVALAIVAGAIFMVVHRITDSGLAVASASQASAPSHWPTVFNLKEQGSTSQPAADVSINNPTAIEMSDAYGFYQGQRLSVAILKQKFPSYARQLEISDSQFNFRFGDAIDNIDRLLQNKSPSWPTFKDQVEQTLRGKINPNTLTADDAASFVKELTRRAAGNIPSPYLETLLTFHPTYMAEPAQEMLDGFKREYKSDGTGAASGLRLCMQYPASWQALPGRQQNAVESFCSENGKGMTMAWLNVGALPPEIGSAVKESDIDMLLQSRIWEQLQPNTTTVDCGVVMLARHRTVWGEYTTTVNRVGIDIQMHGLAFIFLEGNHLVFVIFTAGSCPGLSPVTADDEFRRSGRLFQVMLNSFTVEDQSNGY